MSKIKDGGPHTAYSAELLAKAWELRRQGFYTMREVAEKLGANRERLIAAMKAERAQVGKP